jgi:hypothetical protein
MSGTVYKMVNFFKAFLHQDAYSSALKISGLPYILDGLATFSSLTLYSASQSQKVQDMCHTSMSLCLPFSLMRNARARRKSCVLISNAWRISTLSKLIENPNYFGNLVFLTLLIQVALIEWRSIFKGSELPSLSST